jgi:hypothetical protein
MRTGHRPPVSIVVATYNRRDWLQLAVDSVLDQDYPNLELLVMDDGSTDGTPELLREYERRNPAERFRFSRHENMGQARTLNRGYELARGELMGYLSDDDLLAPGAVSRLVSPLADPQVIAAYPGYRIIDQGGAVVDTIRPPAYSPVEAFRLIDTVIGPGCLARRDALLSTGGWDPALRFMGDFILWIKLGLQGPIVRVPEPLASWRRHGGGLSLQTGAAHGRELLALVGMGAELLELSPDGIAIRAEALRNASIQATFFAGGTGPSPGERFATIDLNRTETSAVTAGLGPMEMPDERADHVAGLWRELARITLELIEARSEGAGGGGAECGLRAAERRLRTVGALSGEGDGEREGWGVRDLRLELMEAAFECGADLDLAASRYLLLERGAGITDDEFDELNRLGYGASGDLLRLATADRRRELERLGGVPKEGNR